MTVVLDASAGVEWVLQSDGGRRVESAVLRHELWVPEHFFVETAAVLRRLVIAGDLTAGRAELALTQLLGAPFHRAQVMPMLSEAWTLRNNVTVADALYIVLARHLVADVVTLDERLAAAPGLDVSVQIP